MKAIRMVLILTVALLVHVHVNAEKKGMKTVVFQAGVHCMSCKTKVEKNIPFEKGVKDLKVDIEKRTVTVTFREDKTNVEHLRKAIEKLNIPVTAIDGKACVSEKKNASCSPDK